MEKKRADIIAEKIEELIFDGTFADGDRLDEISLAADTHYAFMGATMPTQMEDKARAAGRSMLALGVNTVVLAPV